MTKINGRLDVFAIYGPIMKRFPINWFSKPAQLTIKKYLRAFRAGQQNKERQRLGIDVQDSSKTKAIAKPDHRLHLPPMLLVDEVALQHLWSELSPEDRKMCEDFTCLVSGRELQHVVTDAEIHTMIAEINRRDILKVLVSEKGNGAKVMMEEMEAVEPVEFQHNKHTIEKLFSKLETDYYGRYDFRELQIVILEDRRVRMNAWAAKILDIPVQKIRLNKHLNKAATAKERADPRSLHYTLPRLAPLPLISKKPSVAETPLDFPVSIVDKNKYMPNEASMVVNKLLHRHAFKIANIVEGTSAPPSTVFLMKNYNEGRHGQWNNYAGLKGNAVASYVNRKTRFDAEN